jgi:hypothetical protein
VQAVRPEPGTVRPLRHKRVRREKFFPILQLRGLSKVDTLQNIELQAPASHLVLQQ